jgi:MFS family permease
MARSAPWKLPAGTACGARLLLAARALRAFGDGCVSLLLPYYLTLLGLEAFEVGVVIAATLLGAGATTLAAGLLEHRFGARRLLLAGSLLLIAVGIALTQVSGFWPLLLLAALGVLNPSSGDVTVFAPLEHALLARAAPDTSRTALFARYSFLGALVGALGAQAAALPALLEGRFALEQKAAVQAMFLGYAALGAAAWLLYRKLPASAFPPRAQPRAPLARSKSTVFSLAALFSLDAFAGGFAVQSLIALWLLERFALPLEAAAALFFWANLLGALSFLAAPRIAARIGLVRTMVFTHIPANVFLVLVPFMPTLPLAVLFLLLRAALAQMDVPVRASYVMAVVAPEERAAAASVTVVPRSFAAALSPALGGYLLSASPFGWPLVLCGALKIVYDLLLLALFGRVKPPEEP